MSSANRVVKNTGILYAKMGITVFLSLYTTRVVLSSLGINDFGIFNLVGGAIAMLTFLNTAMAAATQRFMSYTEGAGDKEKQKKVFNVSIILHVLIAILVLILLESVGYFLFKGVFKIPVDRIDSAKLVFQFMVCSTLFTIISVPYDAVINAHENMLLYSVLGVVESVFKLLIAIYIAHSTYDRLVTYGFLIAALSVLLLVVRRIYCHRKYQECKISFKTYFDRSIFNELTSFAAWSFLGASTSIVSNYGQGIIMNTFFGPIVNTAQGIAGQVSGQLGVFALTMQKALNPVIDKSEGAGNRSGMLKASLMGSKVSFFLLMLFYVPVLIEMPYIFALWLKTVPPYVIIFCRLLLVRNLIEQLFLTLNSAITAVGNIKHYQIYTSLLNFLPLIVCFILFRYDFPPYALYIVYIFYSTISSGIILHFARKHCDLSIPDFFKNVVFRCVTLFLLTFVVSLVPIYIIGDGFIRLLLIGMTSTLSFFTLVWVIGFNANERISILQIGKSIFARLLPKRLS